MSTVEVDTVLAGKVEQEIWLRLLEKSFAVDMDRHPELPRMALLAELDQYLAGERASARLYDRQVQAVASWVVFKMSDYGRGEPPALVRCGVCAITGSSEHDA